jgi:TatD DNase family protein
VSLTDTHCHLDLAKFDADREAILSRAKAAGIIRILVPGLNLKSSQAAIRLADSHPEVFAAVGIHPTDLQDYSDQTALEAGSLADHPKVVAVGEIGLDYYWIKDESQRRGQQDILKRQLLFAGSISKPVILHMREDQDAWSGQASADLVEILYEWHNELMQANHPLGKSPGVLHSFNGDLSTAQRALEMNFYIGVTGPVTYRNADKKRDLIRQVPLERLLIETDAPYLAPVPHRGERNEPAFVCHIADKIAEIHSISPAEVAAITTRNAARLFAWGD